MKPHWMCLSLDLAFRTKRSLTRCNADLVILCSAAFKLINSSEVSKLGSIMQGHTRMSTEISLSDRVY